MKPTGQLTDDSIVDLIRSIYFERLTGVLEIDQDDARKRLDFVGGELHLSGNHPLARRLALFLDKKRQYRPKPGHKPGVNGEALSQLQLLIQRIVEVLVRMDDGVYSFVEDPDALALDLVGPLPTAYLVMEATVHHQNEVQLLRDLGGEEAAVVANNDPDILTRLYEIEPSEMFLLSRAERPVTVDLLLRQVPMTRETALRTLCRFKAIDLIRPVEEELEPVEAGKEEEDKAGAVVDRFLQRIREEIEAEPVELSPEEHREKLAGLLQKVGSMSHYELLDVGFHASPGEVHAAYAKVARLVHPDHAAKLDLQGKDAAIRLVFEQATQAYLTLSDGEYRARYNLEAGIAAEEAEKYQNLRQRETEQKEVAREIYKRARERVSSEDYHFACELVRQAIRIDPRPEYYALHGEVLAKNPNWLDSASDNYREAVQLDPNNLEYRLALARLLEKTGQPARARKEFQNVLLQEPDHGEALEAMKRLPDAQPEPEVEPGPPPAKPSKGVFGVFKKLWGSGSG